MDKQLTGIRVVVVDDDLDVLHLVKTLLLHAGAEVTTASSVREALPVLAEVRPDILLSDLDMPAADGLELIRTLRARPADEGGKTLAIALTAHVRAEDEARALAAGFDSHLSKPMRASELITAIQHLLRDHGR